VFSYWAVTCESQTLDVMMLIVFSPLIRRYHRIVLPAR
jgi:hypothetical protein